MSWAIVARAARRVCKRAIQIASSDAFDRFRIVVRGPFVHTALQTQPSRCVLLESHHILAHVFLQLVFCAVVYELLSFLPIGAPFASAETLFPGDIPRARFNILSIVHITSTKATLMRK